MFLTVISLRGSIITADLAGGGNGRSWPGAEGEGLFFFDVLCYNINKFHVVSDIEITIEMKGAKPRIR